MPVLMIVSTAPPAQRSAVPAGTRAGRAFWILALLSIIATASPLAAQSDRPLWREPGPSTPRLLVAGDSPADESNRAAATATVLAVQRRVPSATLWVYPTDVVDLTMERLRSDSTVDRAILNYRTLAGLLRAPHWLEVRATIRSSQVELTGRLFRTAGPAPVFVLTVTEATLEAAADSLAARVLRESNLLPVPSRPPQPGDPGDPRPSDRVLSAAPTGAARPRAQVRETTGPVVGQLQQAVLTVLLFRGDVARGTTAIDRCTATLHGGATTMSQLPEMIPGARVIGQAPGANGCVLPVDSSGEQVVLLVDGLEVEAVRSSSGRERTRIEVVTITDYGGYRRRERYLLEGWRVDPAVPPWQVREFNVISETQGSRGQ